MIETVNDRIPGNYWMALKHSLWSATMAASLTRYGRELTDDERDATNKEFSDTWNAVRGNRSPDTIPTWGDAQAITEAVLTLCLRWVKEGRE